MYSAASLYTDSGLFMIYAGTAPTKVDEVLGLIDAEVDKLVAGGITEVGTRRTLAARVGPWRALLAIEKPLRRATAHGVQPSGIVTVPESCPLADVERDLQAFCGDLSARGLIELSANGSR